MNQSTNITFERLGASHAIVSRHMFSPEVKNELGRFVKTTVIGLGQGGGRIASEMSRYGFPTYIVNSSKSDMDEHTKLIPDDRRILTRSEKYAEIEGTSKNAALGLQIAKENQDAYKKIALSDDVQQADFVWVTVSLGGGTGNGALKLALFYLHQVRKNRKLPNGKIPLGVICSLPAKNERGSNFRQNALAGIAELQTLINDGKIGSVLVIDNEKMNEYYLNAPLKTRGGTDIDAKSYSNMLVASLIVETASLPLLKGRAVFDKAEYLDTMSTPGWLSISKAEKEVSALSGDVNVEGIIKDLFTKNEILAVSDFEDGAVIGAIGVVYPENANVPPKVADEFYHFASNLLNSTVHHAVSPNSKQDNLALYGISVMSSAPKRILELKDEYLEWVQKEKEQEEKKKAEMDKLSLSEFSDFLSTDSLSERNEVAATFTDFDDFEASANKSNTDVQVASIDSLDDPDF